MAKKNGRNRPVAPSPTLPERRPLYRGCEEEPVWHKVLPTRFITPNPHAKGPVWPASLRPSRSRLNPDAE